MQKIAQVEPGQKTRDAAAERAGFGNHETYRQASKVVENGTPRLIHAMDQGRVSISAASILADADADEQEAVLELDEKAILQAAKEIRARQAEKRAEHQEAKTPKPQVRPKKERLRAKRLIHGDCRKGLKKREWNLVQDVYWRSHDAMPLSGTNRKQGLLRQSVKMSVWLGPPSCYRNQDNVLWLPSDDIFAGRKSASAMRTSRSGRNYCNGQIAETAEERGGSAPFNLIPVAAGGSAAADIKHPALTPYDVAAWWVKYLLPEKGVLLDCFAGSGTMLAVGLDFGASQVIGIEEHKKYLKDAEKRIVGGDDEH